MEDNDEVEYNDKDDNNFQDISALGLDRDLGFSRGPFLTESDILSDYPPTTLPAVISPCAKLRYKSIFCGIINHAAGLFFKVGTAITYLQFILIQSYYLK